MDNTNNNLDNDKVSNYDEEVSNYDEEASNYDEEASDLDEETRNVVFSASLKNIDNFYNISSGAKHKNKNQNNNNSKQQLQNQKQINNNILGLHNLKPKRHFNPRLPPWDDYKNFKNKNNKKSVLDINNKNMFPEL